MRTSALTSAFLTLATLASTASADDFSALLADLSFSDAPAPALTEPLAVAQEETVEQLKQVPTGLTMPELVESTPQSEPIAEVAIAPPVEESIEMESAPQVALKDPIPVSEPTSDNVDFDAVFATQGVPAIGVESKPVGHVFRQCDNQACDTGIECRPHVKPQLPKSSLYQYFRSDACHTNVWDGYQRHCGAHHKHAHGQCDCFEKSRNNGCHGLINTGGNCSDCGSCDALCDR